MSRCRFVQPETIRLLISDGDFVDVKKELNAGEQRQVFAGMVRDITPGERALVDPAKVGVTKLMAYILGWSFVDADGKPVPFSESGLNALDTETYAEVVAAIDAHEEAVEKARAMRKNAATGEAK